MAVVPSPLAAPADEPAGAAAPPSALQLGEGSSPRPTLRSARRWSAAAGSQAVSGLGTSPLVGSSWGDSSAIPQARAPPPRACTRGLVASSDSGNPSPSAAVVGLRRGLQRESSPPVVPLSPVRDQTDPSRSGGPIERTSAGPSPSGPLSAAPLSNTSGAGSCSQPRPASSPLDRIGWPRSAPLPGR